MPKWLAPAMLVAFILANSEASSAPGLIGYWIRTPDRSVGFALTRGSKGAWVVEIHGTPAPGKPANACWKVFVGTMTGTRLVATSDLGRDFAGQLRADQFLNYGGLFIDFNGPHTRLSGPEANDGWCVLEGNYIRLPGPIM